MTEHDPKLEAFRGFVERARRAQAAAIEAGALPSLEGARLEVIEPVALRIRPVIAAVSAGVGRCAWSLSDEGDGDVWAPSCRGASGLYQFNEGGPLANGFAFCPYCGGVLEERVEPVIDEADA